MAGCATPATGGQNPNGNSPARTPPPPRARAYDLLRRRVTSVLRQRFTGPVARSSEATREREGAIVRRVHLLGDNGEPIAAVTRFLDHLAERGYSPYTLCAYAYDLQNLFTFLAGEGLEWQAFRPADALRLLAFLRRRPSQRSAQRLGLTLITGGESPGRRLSASTDLFPPARAWWTGR